jgi:hypothetical protein
MGVADHGGGRSFSGKLFGDDLPMESLATLLAAVRGLAHSVDYANRVKKLFSGSVGRHLT